MKIIKGNLPEGVKVRFEKRIGKKVKVVNKLYCKKKPAQKKD
jgi:hypothetical protein